MKIPLSNNKYLNCESDDCPFNRECANHETAGDFRSDSGFSPKVEKVGDDYICKTRDSEIDMDADHGVYPKDMPRRTGMVYLSEKGGLVSCQDYGDNS